MYPPGLSHRWDLGTRFPRSHMVPPFVCVLFKSFFKLSVKFHFLSFASLSYLFFHNPSVCFFSSSPPLLCLLLLPHLSLLFLCCIPPPLHFLSPMHSGGLTRIFNFQPDFGPDTSAFPFPVQSRTVFFGFSPVSPCPTPDAPLLSHSQFPSDLPPVFNMGTFIVLFSNLPSRACLVPCPVSRPVYFFFDSRSSFFWSFFFRLFPS